MEKRRAGNPNLDVVRNTDVTNANKARLSKADKFVMGILFEICTLGLIGQLGNKQLMVDELNKHRIKTRRGGEWTRTQYDRFYGRYKQIENSDAPI